MLNGHCDKNVINGALLTLESPSAPEFPEPHHGENEGKAKEEIFERGGGDAGADDRIWVIHHYCFSI